MPCLVVITACEAFIRFFGDFNYYLTRFVWVQIIRYFIFYKNIPYLLGFGRTRMNKLNMGLVFSSTVKRIDNSKLVF